MKGTIPTPSTRSLFLGVAAGLFLLAACGRGFNDGDLEDFGTFRIDVTNDRAPRVRIYLLPDDGESVLLGDAPVEGTTTFRIEPEDPSVAHRLRADLGRNRELISDPFVPVEARGVTWVLSSNDLTREEGDGP